MGDSIRLFHLPFSFMLPQRVASERGYFAEAGLDVELVERDRAEVDWKYIPADETLTEDNDVDLYPICKWESIKRTWDMGDGRIVASGTFADQPYSVYTRPGTDIETPGDLAEVPVGVNMRTGQEYTVRRALEDHLPAAAVDLEHHGMPTDRLAALREGEVAAVSLLEPHSTLAEHLGFEKVLEFENHMGIVGADHVDDATMAAFMEGYERAVAEINDDPESFRDEYLAMLTEDLRVAPDLFAEVDMEAIRASITVPEYETPEFADRAELDDHLDWMKRRGLIDEDADIGAIVAPL
ncbi:nitrate ABC transporter substrate-binding protein [Halobacteriales archaeon QS_1_68_17]|nr:MAG: nitrate ABC transporter substrate-binding protein [Halobacteriales archaeon QS_1_68_17]